MDQSAPLLELDRVFAGYGKMTILNGTSARVGRGAITTVIGPNGAGKSTMFKTVFGLLPARSGTISFDGRDITNCTPRQVLDAGIVFIPQGRNIFPELSVRHNLELGGVALPDQGLLADRIAAIMRRFPILQEKANAQASTLSGGQQKLLELARVLVAEPRLILLDEPAAGVNAVLLETLVDRIVRLNRRGVTFLVIEHNIELVLTLCRPVVVMAQGKLIYQGDAAGVRRDRRVLDAYLGDVPA